MNKSQSYRTALFLLVLLLSNEGIALATNIRQTKILRKNVEIQESLEDLKSWQTLKSWTIVFWRRKTARV